MRLLEEEDLALMSQLTEMEEAREAAVLSFEGQSRKVRYPKARVRTLSDELDLLELLELANCILKVITCKVADSQGGITILVTGLHRNTVSSYDVTRRSADEALVEVSKCLEKSFDREARSLEQDVRDAVRAVAESTRGPFAGAPSAVHKSLGVIIERAGGKGESASAEGFLLHTEGRDACSNASRICAKSADVLLRSTMSILPGAHYTRDYLVCGA